MKRNMKKTLSLLLSLTMLIGMLTFMSANVSAEAAASAEIPVMKETFDNYGDAYSAKLAGWIKYIDPDTAPDGIEQVDAEHGKSMKIVGKQYFNQYLTKTGTTGKYTLKTSMYLQEDTTKWEDAYLVAFFGKDGTNTENILAEFGRADSERNIGGPIKIGGADTDTRFTADTWYDIVADIDLDSGSYDVTISDANGTVASGTGSFTANSSIQYVVFRSWQGNNTYIDNVEFGKYTEKESEYLWEETFEWDDVMAYRSNGIISSNPNADTTSTTPMALETVGDGSYGKSLKLSSGTTQFAIPLGKTSGTYEVKFSINPINTENIMIFGFGAAATGGFVGATDNNGTANTIVTVGRSSSFYLAKNEESGAPRHSGGTYEVGKWYDITAIIDLDSRLYKTTIKQGDTVLSEKTRIMDTGTNLNYFRFLNWGGKIPCYFDNFSVKATDEEVSKVIVFDDFNDYTTVAYGITANQKNLFNNGWTAGLKTWEDSANGGVLPVLDSITHDSQVLEFENGTKGLTYEFPTPIKEGKVKISYKMTGQAGERLGFALKDTISWTDAQQEVIYSGSPSAPNSLLGSAGVDREKFFDMAVDEWYDIENVFDMDKKTVSVRVLKDGETIGLKKDIAITKASQLSVITFYGWKTGLNDNAGFSIDDFKVELIDDAETTYDYLIEENDFEDVSHYLNLENISYSFDPRAGASYAIAEDGTNKVFKLSGNASRIAKTLAGASTGKLRFTYDIKTDGIAVITYTGINSNTAWKNHVLLGYIHSGGLATHTYTAEESYKFFNYTADSWITMENVIDLDNKTISYKAYDDAGNLLGSATQEGLGWINLSEDDGDDVAGLNGFWVRNWGLAGTSVSIDNVKFEYYYGIPSIDESAISMTNISDEEVDLLAETITPGIKTITLDFGAELTEDSVDGAILLKEKNGTDTYEGALSGEKYIFTLADGLKEDTTYEITVDGTVATALGYELGESFTYEFKTSSAKCVITADGIYNEAGTTKLTTVSGLLAGGKIYAKANAVNDKAVSETVTFIIAYYNASNVLVSTDIEAVTVESGYAGEIGNLFTLPDMTDVSKISVFVWNNAVDAVPYCASVSI